MPTESHSTSHSTSQSTPSLGKIERAVAIAALVALAGYGVAFIDPYVPLAMAPFFALGARRGKHPLALSALAAAPALVILIVSVVKYQLTGMPLVFADHYMLRQNAVILAFNDWRVAILLVLWIVVPPIYLYVLFKGSGPFTRFERTGLVVLTAGGIAAAASVKSFDMRVYDWDQAMNRPGLAALVQSASIPDPELERLPSGAAETVVSEAPLTPPAGGLPDLFFILQESTFYPQLLRPDYRPKTLFAERPALNGKLHVHTWAGGTWRTEFTIATQMRPQEFGGDGLYVFHQLEGRVKRSIYDMLKKIGYRVIVLYPTPGNFINGEAFYRSIGVEEFYDPATSGAGQGWDWDFPDSVLYDTIEKQIAGYQGPVAVLALTIKQHGPHKFDDPMTDYVERFEASDKAFAAFLERREKSGRRTGVVAFGDHQPEFTIRFIDDRPTLYQAAYDIRCLNFECGPTTAGGPDRRDIDVVLLPGVALEAFGFGLDGFSKMLFEQYRDCIADVTQCANDRRLAVNTAFARYFD